MKARVNTHAFRQVNVESAHIGVLGTIAHCMPDEGEYAGTVLQNGAPVATLRLSVDERFENQQVDVDLTVLAAHRPRHLSKHVEPTFSLAPNGYLLLYVSEGPGGFVVQLQKLGRKRPRPVFDSRNLQEGDLFIVSLLRPGRYVSTNKHGLGRSEITVAYPKRGTKRYTPDAPSEVTVTPKTMRPARISVGAAQGIIFRIESPRASIKVELDKADDGPRGKGVIRDKTRWTNPRTPRG